MYIIKLKNNDGYLMYSYKVNRYGELVKNTRLPYRAKEVMHAESYQSFQEAERDAMRWKDYVMGVVKVINKDME